jgi:hypothetical protein
LAAELAQPQQAARANQVEWRSIEHRVRFKGAFVDGRKPSAAQERFPFLGGSDSKLDLDLDGSVRLWHGCISVSQSVRLL